jgi:polyhydroxyalkanoate synthase
MPTAEFWQRQGEAFVRKVNNMPQVIAAAKNARVGATPTESVYRRDRLQLLRYAAGPGKKYETPLLVVFALVNRPYILDLREGKSVVAHFVNAGFDTYNLDWGVPTSADRHLGMKEYIEGYMDDVVDRLRAFTGSDRVNILGYCMGGSMSAIYTALNPDKVENLILMAAPVDWSDKSHLLAKWTEPDVFDVDKLIDVCGNAPAEMLQQSFLMLKPVSNLVEKYINFYENMENEKFLETFFAMEAWLNDNIPVAGEMFREFVKHCMQQDQLMQGKLRVGERTVNLGDITCPLLNLTAEQDHLVPCGQSLTLNDKVGSEDEMSMVFPAGHIGLAVGRRAHSELWPQVCDWLKKRSQEV